MRSLILNSSALQHNLNRVRFYAPFAKIMAMVKADAYGHGIVWTAKHLVEFGVDALAVAVLSEALVLRQAGITIPIVLIEGVENADEMQQAINANLSFVFHQAEQITWLEQQQTNIPIMAWLKIDTGMHRLGFSKEQARSAFERLQSLHFIQKPIGLMTHFSDADDPSHPKTQMQIDCFNQIKKTLPSDVITSLANSAAIITRPQAHGDWVRPGIMLYGASPILGHFRDKFDLQAVMTVKSSLIAMQSYEKGEAIGYGSTFVCEQKTLVGVVAFGYGDGYPRHVKFSKVLIRNKPITVIGRISMDLLMVDLNALPEAQLHDSVTLWGEDLPVEALAENAGAISYEIFCQLQRSRIKSD